MITKIRVMLTWIKVDAQYALWHFVINFLAASVITPRPLRYYYYRLCRMDVRTPSLQPGLYFRGPAIRIGEKSFVNTRCFFENGSAPVEIGSSCEVAMEVMFCTATHEIGPEQRRSGAVVGLPIRVEDGCWIGARATILPGVTIKRGCIIAAGAVVAKDCDPNGLYAGVPARRIKDLPCVDAEIGRARSISNE